jgi:hypothetical protein
MGHSEVDKARLLPSGEVEIRLLLPNSAKGSQLVIQAVVRQRPLPGQADGAMAHTSHVFTPAEDGAAAVFAVPLAEGSPAFNPKVGIEVRATSTYACWSALDGTGHSVEAETWTWTLGDWG